MMNGKEILSDKPDGFVGGHPVKAVKACQIDGTRKSSQRALSPQVEISLEVAHGQFAEAAIDRLAIAAPGVIGLRNGPPVAIDSKKGNDVICVALRLQIED